MNYVSTRDKSVKVSAAKAIAQGISTEGGLFVPDTFPTLSVADFEALIKMNYIERAKFVLSQFLNDFSEDEVDYCVKGAYTGSFDNEQPAPISLINKNANILELWHGPTCAFKDLALQLLPYLLTTSAKKVNDGKKTVILVATSGDTGKAALEGFKDVPDTEILVFYPSEGVSPMQKLQMDSQKGENVHVCAIKGNFDDAQTGVKKIFTDNAVKEKLAENNMLFSSANSINWGRLAPQIVYYVSAYCDLLEREPECVKDGFNIVVPTGNFGNILAAYYAKKMGVPVNRLICASNANNVLTDFIKTGTYDRNRNFYTTISPSMDILISSNLERMLFELSGNNDKEVAALQDSLSKNGTFTVSDEIKTKMGELFWAGCCDDKATLETIGKYFDEYSYLCDTHTAVAMNVYEQYVNTTGDDRPTVIASTASPYKFAKSVLSAVSGKTGDSEFDTVRVLSEETNTEIPEPIKALENAKVRFKELCEKDDMLSAVYGALGI
ncbi:MAG: threonine synthase [Ruminococcaceae bacterium]|nr:threonine synthase [Oscillospiraceae bacterium]